MDPQRLLLVVALPGALCMAVLLTWAIVSRSARAAQSDGEPERRGRFGVAWGGAIGYLAAMLLATYFVLGRWPALKPTGEGDWLPYATPTGEGWLPYLTIASVLVWLAASVRGVPAFVRAGAAGVVAVAVVALILRPIIAHEWVGSGERAVWIAGLSIGVALFWWSLRGLAGVQRDAWSLPLTLWLCAAGASGVQIVASASASLAELFATLAACFGASVVVGAWRGVRLDRGAVHVVVVYYAGVLIAGYAFGMRDSIFPTLLTALAPSAAWVGHLGPVARRKAWQRVAIQMAAVGVVLAAAIVVGLLTTAVDPYGY